MASHDTLSRLAQRGYSPFTSEVRAVATPGVGADFSQTVDPGQAWRLRAVRARLTTSAVVANRAPALVIDNQSTTAMELPVTTVIAASLVTDITWVAGYAPTMTAVVGNRIAVAMPDIYVAAGWRIRVNTNAIDVGDAWSGITVWIDRMDSPPTTLNRALGVPVDDLIDFLIEQQTKVG